MANLTPRENFIRFFNNQPTEWIPTSADQLSFNPEIIPDNVARAMVSQQTRYTGPVGGNDFFGVEWVFIPTVGGSMEKAPLLDSIDEWEDKVVFTDLSKLDWEGCARANSEYLKTDKMIRSTIFTGFFERLISFIGFEDAAVALVDEDQQEYVLRLFDKLADFYIEEIKYMHRYFGTEIVELHDDWGAQKAPFFSVDTHLECIIPYIRKVVEAAHAEGIFMEMHSCGIIMPLIPGLISTGIDTWRGQPLNDKLALVNTYGDRFKFGVEIREDGPVTDERLAEMVAAFKRDYTGKRVWISLGRTFTPAQRQFILDELNK